MNIETVKDQYEERLMRLPNVIGVGIGEKLGRAVIKVFVTHKVLASNLQPVEIVPKQLAEYETDLDEIGIITAQSI